MRNPNARLAHFATRKGPLHVDAPSDDDAPLEVGDASLTAVLRARAAVDKIGACAGHARITWFVGQDRGVIYPNLVPVPRLNPWVWSAILIRRFTRRSTCFSCRMSKGLGHGDSAHRHRAPAR